MEEGEHRREPNESDRRAQPGLGRRPRGLLPPAPIAFVRLAPMLALLHLVLAETTPAEEGLNIILVMLGVGFIFIGVIALGELTHYLRDRR